MPQSRITPGIEPLEELIPIPTADEVRALSKKKKKRKNLVALGLVVVVLIIAVMGIMSLLLPGDKDPKEGGMGVEPAIVTRGNFEQVVTGEGKLEPVSSVLVNSELGGTVQKVSVTEGQIVKKGDELFTTKNSEITEALTTAKSTFSAASAQVTRASQELSKAKSRVSSAKKELSSAKTELRRAKASNDEARIEEATLAVNNAAQAVEIAQGEQSAASAALESAKPGRDAAQAELNKIQDQLSKAKVVAPIDGTVIGVTIKKGSQLAADFSGDSGSPLGAPSTTSAIEIADLSSLVMRTAVSEEEVVLIENGLEAKVSFAALPGVEATAKVIRVAPRANGSVPSPGTGQDMGVIDPSQNAEVTFNVDIEIEDPDPRLKYGMTAEASILVQSLENVFLVAHSALIQEGSKFFVEALDETGNSLGTREVEVLATDEITAALGDDNLSEGLTVAAFPAIDSPLAEPQDGGKEPALEISVEDVSSDVEPR